MPTDIHVSNPWFVVIALASLVQVIGVGVAVFVVLRLARKAETMLASVERQVAPLAARANGLMDDLHHVTVTVREADSAIRSAAGTVATTVDRARTLVAWRLWPVLGAVRGVTAAVDALRARRSARSARAPRQAAPEKIVRRQDAIAEARFTDEGGPVYGRDATIA